MDAIDLIRRIHQHRAWVNRNLMQSAATLTMDQLQAPFPIGQGSLWKSLLHMYAAEYVWLETLLGDPSPLTPGDLPRMLPGNQQGEGAIGSFAQLHERWIALESRWSDYLATLAVDRLNDQVDKFVSLTGAKFTTRRSDILLHVCTHAHYTSAQVVNMLRHSGVTTLPDTMLIMLARQEMAAAT